MPISILIVDDEKNIRLTLSLALEGAGHQVETAADGGEALAKLEATAYDVMLLDLKMPGVDGITVLRRLVKQDLDTRVIIISAHGTVENAVEAMKLGALDFIQKPFTPQEIRGIVADVVARDEIDARGELTYEQSLAVVKRLAGKRRLEDAIALARDVAGRDLDRPEAFNLLGVLQELRGYREQAQKNYRIALDISPTYAAARDNLNRIGSHARRDEQPRFE